VLKAAKVLERIVMDLAESTKKKRERGEEKKE